MREKFALAKPRFFKRLKNSIFFCFFSLLSLSCLGEELVKGWTSTYSEPNLGTNCDVDTNEAAKCMDRISAYSNKFLKEITDNIGKSISKDQLEPFNESNQYWYRFRDASCEFDVADTGGTSKRIRFKDCIHSYNKRRIDLLSKYLYCIRGGDCPNDLRLYYLTN